jgi:hypothetical protein
MSEQRSSGGFVHTIAKRAFAPLIAAATAFLLRKGTELWQDKVQPKLDERGGATAVASDALESVADKLPTQQTASTDDTERDEERRQREQRRAQRRRSLEQAKSS